MAEQESPIVALVDHAKTSLVDALKSTPLGFEEFVVGLKAACMASEQLTQCVRENPGSVIQRVVEAAQLGLSPAPVKQHFYLIPRKIDGKLTCTKIVGVRGYVYLANRGGNVIDQGVGFVYTDEDIGNPWRDPATGRPNHTPDPFREFDAKKLRGAYGCIQLKGYERVFVHTMTIEDLNKRRRKAQTQKIWNEWEKEMYTKTVVLAMLKDPTIPIGEDTRTLVSTADMQEAQQDDDVAAIKTAEAVVTNATDPHASFVRLFAGHDNLDRDGIELDGVADGALFIDAISNISRLDGGAWVDVPEDDAETVCEEMHAMALMHLDRAKVPNVDENASTHDLVSLLNEKGVTVE